MTRLRRWAKRRDRKRAARAREAWAEKLIAGMEHLCNSLEDHNRRMDLAFRRMRAEAAYHRVMREP